MTSVEEGFVNESAHVPVMLAEVLEALQPKPEGSYLDVTGGAGGHSAAILDRLGSAGSLVVGDWSEKAVALLEKKFAHDKRVRVVRSGFSEILEKLEGDFDGILADFGVSSLQLDGDAPGIAFSRSDDELDMRLDNRKTARASDLIATWDAEDLAKIFYEYGGERGSRKIAAAIVMDRKEKPFVRVRELRELCERVLGRFYRGAKIHPATRVFQALRIAVNDELGEIEKFLKKAPQRLVAGGRLVTISFHEGEDRQVKQIFRALAAGGVFALPVRKAVKPGEDEVSNNPRARSARLRSLEKK